MKIAEHLDFTVRRWEYSDAEALAKNINDKKVWDNCRDSLPYPYTQLHAHEYLKSVIERNNEDNYCIAIDGTAVGNISFSRGTDIERFSAEIGYWISARYQNKNIMSRALADVIAHYFATTPTVRIFANVFGFNQSSHRVLRKSGFYGVGVKYKAAFKNGQFTNMYEYETLKENGYITFERTDADSSEFIALVADLEEELNSTNSVYRQGIYNKYNIVSGIDTVIVAYHDGVAAGCGCYRKYDDNTIELKRMFVRKEFRRKGISNLILNELERWGRENNYSHAVLETGKQHIEAISLYEKNGYKRIDNYGDYKDIENSVCFAREIV